MERYLQFDCLALCCADARFHIHISCCVCTHGVCVSRRSSVHTFNPRRLAVLPLVPCCARLSGAAVAQRWSAGGGTDLL